MSNSCRVDGAWVSRLGNDGIVGLDADTATGEATRERHGQQQMAKLNLEVSANQSGPTPQLQIGLRSYRTSRQPRLLGLSMKGCPN